MKDMTSFKNDKKLINSFNPVIIDIYNNLSRYRDVDLEIIRKLNDKVEYALAAKSIDILDGNLIGPLRELSKDPNFHLEDLDKIEGKVDSLRDVLQMLKEQPRLFSYWDRNQDIKDAYYGLRFRRYWQFLNRIPEKKLINVLQKLKAVEDEPTLLFISVCLSLLDDRVDYSWAVDKLCDYKYCLYAIRICNCYEHFYKMRYRIETMDRFLYDLLKVYYHFSVYYKKEDEPEIFQSFLQFDRLYSKILDSLPKGVVYSKIEQTRLLDKGLDNYVYVSSSKGDISIPTSSYYTFSQWFVREFRRILEINCMIVTNSYEFDKSTQIEFEVRYPGFSFKNKPYNKVFSESFVVQLLEDYSRHYKEMYVEDFSKFIVDILDSKLKTGTLDFYFNYCYFSLKKKINDLESFMHELKEHPNYVWDTLIYICDSINSGDELFVALLNSKYRMSLMHVVHGFVERKTSCMKAMIRSIVSKFGGSLEDLDYVLDTCEKLSGQIRLCTRRGDYTLKISNMISNNLEFIQNFPINSFYNYKVSKVKEGDYDLITFTERR